MAIKKYKGRKYCNGSSFRIEDALTLEQALSISVNGRPFTVTMQTPGNETELTRGLLFTENVYTDIHTHPLINILDKDEKGYVRSLNVNIPGDELGSGADSKRNIMSVSSCGICGKTELEDIHRKTPLRCEESLVPSALRVMFEKMNSSQDTFLQSGGSHACGAFDLKGDLLSLHEDIGRHNAVDKVIGDLILKGSLTEAKCMTVSGRISYEIVSKCYAAGIPFLAAVSAPSSLAVDMAEELGITLLGFCRKGKFTAYSQTQRIGKSIKEKAI